MRRFSISLAALSLLSLALTGCCCSSLCGGGYGAGYAPMCAPACPPTYGAGFGAAPMVTPNCPTGNCGVYPTGAFYGPAGPVAAAMPGAYATAALPLNPVPTY